MKQVNATGIFQKLTEAEETWDTAVLEGSSRSSKTYSIIQYLITKALETPGTVIRAFRNDGTTCAKTIIVDFMDIMGKDKQESESCFHIWKQENWNKQDKRYIFENGSKFYFDGTQDVGKLHGLKQDYAWFNEVMEIVYDAWVQVEMRTTVKCIVDFNPSISNHWCFKTLLSRDSGVLYLHSTYLDNPFLTEKQIRAIECLKPTEKNIKQGTANEWKWRVYGLGERAGRTGRVYTNYRQTDFFPDKNLCTKHGYGLDFGFSSDPTSLVECAIFQNELYVRLICYRPGLLPVKSISRPTIPSIQGVLEKYKIGLHEQIIADSARPDTIAELVACGYNVIKCRKGNDSIVNGISIVQGLTIVVHRKSTDIIEELENYTWQKERSSDMYLDKPIDEYNHALDAIRYWVTFNLDKNRLSGKRSRLKLPTFAEDSLH